MNERIYQSETEKYRHLTEQYCRGVVLDIASQGDPVVPWAWQIDLPKSEYAHYNANTSPRGPIQLRGHGESLPVDDNSLDTVYCSHLLEDFPEGEWDSVIGEWLRVLKPGGHLVILCPDKKLWADALAAGQCPNCSHRFEPSLGDISRHAANAGAEIVEERLTDLWPGDYSILFVGRKKSIVEGGNPS